VNLVAIGVACLAFGLPAADIDLGPAGDDGRPPPGPLFDPAQRWAPGDSEQAGFTVRNAGPTTAGLWVSVTGDGDTALVDVLRLDARVDGGPWRNVRLDGRRTPLGRVTADASADVIVRAELPFEAGDELQRTGIDLDVRVGMHGDSGPGDDRPSPDDEAQPGGGLLPETGSSAPASLTALAALLLIAGAALRRRWRP